MDTEHLFMLPINWFNYHEVPDVHVKIAQSFYNANCTPTYFFAEKDFDGWDPKIHGPHNYLQSFHVVYFIYKCGTNKHYPLAMFLNGISKKTRSSYIGIMEDGIPFS